MRAIVQERYGPPEVLRLDEDAERPTVDDDGVLIRVRAASVNAADWHLLRADPFLVRLGEGFLRPKKHTFGIDAAGIIEEVGANVTHVKPGDEVFGVTRGSCAEYASGPYFVRKPANITFEEAAAVPVAAITALQAVRDQAQVKPGQKVLVNGAGGGVGTFAVQIAKAFGAEVTAVTSTGNIELMHTLGADHVIDYTKQDFTTLPERYDAILDVAGRPSLKACRRALAPGGTLVLVGAGSGAGGAMGRIIMGSLRALVRQRVKAFISKESNEDLTAVGELIETGKVRPVIDRTYPLDETPDALIYLETGKARGKVVITI